MSRDQFVHGTDATAAPVTPCGSLSGTVRAHTAESSSAVFDAAYVAAPGACGIVEGTCPEIKSRPDLIKAPAVLFMHGSSGITEPVRAFGRFVAGLGVLFVAPDSMATADRITYSSPIAKDDYEDLHAMRLEELKTAVRRLPEISSFNGLVVLAGTSEGGVPVARFDPQAEGAGIAGRMIFSWSCEDNYFVKKHGTALCPHVPTLNVMSAQDKYFSRCNAWLGNDAALGHAAQTLKDHPDAAVVLIPGAPHTLMNLDAARRPIEGFLRRVLNLS